MKLGLALGAWGSRPPGDIGARIVEAERLGYDAVFTAENYGSDAFTPLAWWGSRTTRILLGTQIVPIAARTPTATAMAALTLDHLTGGRHVLGLGVSGPRVVEGWYGRPFERPLAQTREYVRVIRQVFARQAPVTNAGPHFPVPYCGEGSVGLGTPLKSIVHPLRSDLPIWLAAEGPRNIALCAEIADGWMPIFYSPRMAPDYRTALAEGFARDGARRSADDFAIASSCKVVVTDDRDEALDRMKEMVGFYIGGMGSKEMNFHKDLFARMGYEAAAERVQQLYAEGRANDAYREVSRDMVADISLVGSVAEVRDGVAAWEESGVTMLIVQAEDEAQMRRLAEVVLDR